MKYSLYLFEVSLPSADRPNTLYSANIWQISSFPMRSWIQFGHEQNLASKEIIDFRCYFRSQKFLKIYLPLFVSLSLRLHLEEWVREDLLRRPTFSNTLWLPCFFLLSKTVFRRFENNIVTDFTIFSDTSCVLQRHQSKLCGKLPAKLVSCRYMKNKIFLYLDP